MFVFSINCDEDSDKIGWNFLYIYFVALDRLHSIVSNSVICVAEICQCFLLTGYQ